MPNGTDDSMSSRKAESDVNGENTFKIGNFSVDEARPIKVVVIGAGYSGKHYSVHCQCHPTSEESPLGITAGIRYVDEYWPHSPTIARRIVL